MKFYGSTPIKLIDIMNYVIFHIAFDCYCGVIDVFTFWLWPMRSEAAARVWLNEVDFALQPSSQGKWLAQSQSEYGERL